MLTLRILRDRPRRRCAARRTIPCRSGASADPQETDTAARGFSAHHFRAFADFPTMVVDGGEVGKFLKAGRVEMA